MRNGEVSHDLMGGKLHVFRRERSSRWQCSTYLAGREHRASTKTDKVAHRAWFSPDEYRQLYTATRARANDKANHRRKAAAHLHDYVLFMANTGLRPDEAARLQYRDVAIVDDEESHHGLWHLYRLPIGFSLPCTPW
jgi:integrase